MKAKEFENTFDEGDSVFDTLDLSKAKRVLQEQKRVNVDFPCQSALKSIHLTASNNVQQLNKVIPFSAPFYAA